MESRKRKKKKLRIKSLTKLVQGILPGQFKSEQSSSRGIVIVEKRKFVPGRDPFSSYDWKTMLKARPEAYSRERMRHASLMVVVDISNSMFFTTSSEITKIDLGLLFLQLAYDFACSAGNLAGALIFDWKAREFQAPTGPGGLQEMIEVVANHPCSNRVSPPSNFQPALKELIISLPQRSLILIVSDFCFEFNYQQELMQLSDFHDVIPIVVEDPEDDISAPWASYFVMRDMETGQLIRANSIKKDRSYLDFFKQISLEPFIISTQEGEEKICIRLNEFFAKRRFGK